jgi:hypothetical protein
MAVPVLSLNVVTKPEVQEVVCTSTILTPEAVNYTPPTGILSVQLTAKPVLDRSTMVSTASLSERAFISFPFFSIFFSTLIAGSS